MLEVVYTFLAMTITCYMVGYNDRILIQKLFYIYHFLMSSYEILKIII